MNKTEIMTITEFYKHLQAFVRKYGGQPPRISSPRSFDLMRDYASAGNLVYEFKLVKRENKNGRKTKKEMGRSAAKRKI